MSHKILIKFAAVKNADKIIRDTWVSTIWHLLAVADPAEAKRLHDSTEMKGFVWNVTKENDEYLMEFSSILPKLVSMIETGAKKYKEGQTAFQMADDILLKVTDAFGIDDIRDIPSCLRLSAVTGMILDRKFPHKKIRYFQKLNPGVPIPKKDDIHPFDDQVEFCKRLKRNLCQKAKELLDQDFTTKDFNLRIITSGTDEEMPFRNIPLVGHRCSVQIAGPKPILELALYAGLGRMNGLGFGMMTIMKKKATA